MGRAPDRRLPPAEEVEERESLEVAPEVQSLERDPTRQARVEVDQDDEAERIVARRMAAAEAQGEPLTKADHRAFDERIRQEAADKTATKGYTARQLRDAVVWREILGPPVSLREEGRGAVRREAYRSAELLRVRLHRLHNRLPRRRRALESPRLRPRSFEILVHLKEVLDLLEVVRRDVRRDR